MGKPRDAANHFKNFPTVDSAFADDFTVLPTFVPTDTLEHLKNCQFYSLRSHLIDILDVTLTEWNKSQPELNQESPVLVTLFS